MTDSQPGNGDEAPQPLAALADALADVLVGIGWNGERDTIAGEVRRPEDGTTLGRIEIHLLPLSAVIVNGTIAQVTSTAFVGALRTAWAAADLPPLPAQQLRALLAPAQDASEDVTDGE